MKIAVASGKGGTGKTFFSTNLFVALRQAGKEAMMVDCDAEVPDDALFLPGNLLEEKPTEVICPVVDPDLCRFCGQCSRNCRFNAITCLPSLHYVKVHEDFCHGCGACILECPFHAVQESRKAVGRIQLYELPGFASGKRKPDLIVGQMQEGEHSPVPVIRHAIREALSWNPSYLILDAPPGSTCPFVNTVNWADWVILVSEPTPFGLSDLRQTVRILREMGKAFCVVVNRADIGISDLSDWLAEEQIPVLAEIPYSQEIAATYAEGRLAVKDIPSVNSLFETMLDRISEYENCSCKR